MTSPKQFYQSLVDGFVKISDGVEENWVTKSGYPSTDDNRSINDLLHTLDASQKEVIALMLGRARSGGIHDSLVYLQDRMSCDGLTLSEDGVELPIEPYDTPLHYDWTCRMEGDDWPK